MLPSTTAEPYRARIRLTLDSVLHARPRVDQRLLVLVAALACIPLAFLVYWPAVNAFFMSDDFLVLRAVRDRSTWDVIVRAFSFPEASPFNEATLSWRPLTDLYVYAMSPLGVHAQPYHVINIALHGVVGALGVLLVRRLTSASLTAAATGVLFVVAPTYDFTVGWTVEVSELTIAICILGAMLSYHSYLTSERAGGVPYVATCVFVAIGVLSKESVLLFAVLLPALGLWAQTSAVNRRSRSEVVRSLLLPLLALAIYAIVIQVHDANQNDPTRSLGTHVIRNAWHYLRWLVLPYQDGRYEAIRSFLAVSFLCLGFASIAARRWTIAFFFVWTFVAFLPYTEIKIIELRYTYLATLPFIAFLACGAVEVLQKLPSRWQPIIAAIGVCLVIAATALGAVRSRDIQRSLAQQASAYETTINATRNLCGPMQTGSYIYLVNPPFFDAYGLNAPAALNLYYDHAYVASVHELPSLAAFIKNKCVIQYDVATGTYTRVDM
jgi:hypothetical protein